MDLYVTADGVARFGQTAVVCALGRGGLSATKREGDGATPIGSFLCRWLYWRADRIAEPITGLAKRPLSVADGWCDDPASPAYNRFVRLPFSARHEALWREDRVYDIVVVLGYNDHPTIGGAGSAIFLHVARPDLTPTEGCVAMRLPDLQHYLRRARPGSKVIIG